MDHQPIKILHIIPSLTGGGAERQLVDVVSNTSGEEFSHLVCSLGEIDFFAEEIRKAGHRALIMGLKGKYPWLAAARRIHKVVREYQPNVLHSWLYNGDIVARLVKLRNYGIPLVTSLQSPSYEPESIAAGGWSPTKVGLLRLVDAGLGRIANQNYIACSKFVASSAERRLGIDPSRISVIYNSVDPTTLACDPGEPERIREELGISADSFIYLGVGRLDAGKGFAHLIRSFRIVADEVPAARLVIVGSGPFEDELQKLAVSVGLADRIVMPGRRRDIGAFLEMADAFVFPTRFEGLGIALIEAMSKSLPCIASKLPVLEEVIENEVSGLLVEPNDEAEWTQAMLRTYKSDDLRDRLGRAASEKVKSQFLSSVLMPQWEGAYRRISLGASVVL